MLQLLFVCVSEGGPTKESSRMGYVCYILFPFRFLYDEVLECLYKLDSASFVVAKPTIQPVGGEDR